MPSIVYPIEPEFALSTWFAWVNAGLAAVATVMLAALFLQNQWRLGRPAFAFAGLVNLLYQWPVAFLATPIESALASPWAFAGMAHMVVFLGIGWIVATDRLTIPRGTTAPRYMTAGVVVAPVILLLVFSALYFARVPLRCTALFALLYDPDMTLLAREVTIKLAGSTLASSSYGALANTVAPVIAAIGAARVIDGFLNRRLIQVVLWLGMILVAVSAVMIAGAKGLMIPLIGVVVVSAWFWSTSLIAKIVSAVISVIAILTCLSAFEVLKERGGGSRPYDFSRCIVELGSVQQGEELLASMRERGGLGLSPSRIEDLEKQTRQSSSKLEETTPYKFPPRREMTPARAGTYVGALVNRAFITPTQVAAWHFLYVQEYGSPGIGAAPFAKKIFGYSVDAPSLVAMKYGTIYSDGDATSTSTSPTSFIYSWPAYFGLFGVFFVILAIVTFDLAFSMITNLISSAVLPISAGLSVVISFNMITSDFVTVMFSHGGGVAILLLACFGIVSFAPGKPSLGGWLRAMLRS